MRELTNLPWRLRDRTPNTYYTHSKRGIVYWDGARNLCKHFHAPYTCKRCGGSALCEHGVQRAMCKPCGGRSICEHGKQRARCIPCGGASMCEHGRQRASCIPCGGSSVCQHGKQRAVCKACGGSQICQHGRLKQVCVPCDGPGICQHKRVKRQCKVCSPDTYLVHLMRVRVRHALKGTIKSEASMSLVGCSIAELKDHIQSTWTEGMSWQNQGEGGWEIDHIKPCAKFDLTDPAEQKKCFHWSNLQALWKLENNTKSAKFDPATFGREWNGSRWCGCKSV